MSARQPRAHKHASRNSLHARLPALAAGVTVGGGNAHLDELIVGLGLTQGVRIDLLLLKEADDVVDDAERRRLPSRINKSLVRVACGAGVA